MLPHPSFTSLRFELEPNPRQLQESPIDPTVTLELPGSSNRTSQPNVNLLLGTGPNFEDETRELLRQRLFAAAVGFGGILLYAFFGNVLLGNFELWWIRFLFLAVFIGVLVKLWRPVSDMWQLRLCEFLVFGIFFVQLALMMSARLIRYSASQDFGSVAAVQYGYLAAFSILVLAYGIFIPNRWQRGAVVILLVSALPHTIFWGLKTVYPQVAEAMNSIDYTSPVPIMVMAAGIGIMGTHTINAVRQQAYQARKFGQYRLGRQLGEGGMGQVFEAEHVLLKRPCAIKLIRPESEQDEKAIRSFEREVKATAQLTHWNTIEIYDYGRTDDGTFYYVMELLEGMSVSDLISQYGPIPEQRVTHLLLQLCEALQEAHDIGLIHRDLKPANIFVTRMGRQFDVLKLLDFGLVKVQQRSDQVQSEGTFSGTPLYMSPEQAIAYESVDGRSDVYSIGCVAYMALTGEPPFVRPTLMSTLDAHAADDVVPPSALNSSITEAMNLVVLRCLQKEPADRFQSAFELADALSKLQYEQPWDNRLATKWWSKIPKRNGDADEGTSTDDDAPTFILPTLQHEQLD